MIDYKPMLASRTVQAVMLGILLKLVAIAAAYFGYEFEDEAQKQAADLVLTFLPLALSFGTDVAAIVFRVKATKRIG